MQRGSRSGSGDIPVFTKAYDMASWLIDRTEKFPKSTRFTFGQRIDNLALDVVMTMVEARYSQSKIELLRRANLNLEKLRVLVRMASDRKYLTARQYGYGSGLIDEVGRMVGGWMKQQRGR